MPKIEVSPEEARHIMKRRRSERRDEWFQAGLNAAASLVGERIPGAAGEELADAIIGIKRQRNTKQKEG
jgi:hypothetical protein